MSNKKKPPLERSFDSTVPEEAVEFLSQPDIQSLFDEHLGDEVVNATIEKLKAHPDMSTREAKLLIAACRQARNELKAAKEQTASVNSEMARLNAQYDLSKAEEQRLQREMEQMRRELLEIGEATGRLRNELELVASARNALHQHISETEKERDAARREVAEIRKRLARWDDAEARAHLRRINEQYGRRLTEFQQLDARIEALRAEEVAIGVKLREGKAAFEARSRVDAQMNALWVDFGEFAQRFYGVQLLCAAEGNPERYGAIFGALAEVVGKFQMEIVAASKGCFKKRARRARRRAGAARSRLT